MIYLDNSATTKPLPSVVAAMTDALEENFGNPSSLYRLGSAAEAAKRNARKAIASSIGASADEVFFTSCGTESDNSVIKGVWKSLKKRGRRIITTAVEHPAVLEACRAVEADGAEVVYLPVDRECKISLADLEAALTDDTVLVSVMHVNNEIGTIMPVEEIGALLRKRGILFHSDCVQSYGKLPIDVSRLPVDFISLSAHKIHGPKGIGALYIRKGTHLPVFMHGGGQERGFRSGTENTSGIAGFGAAAMALSPEGADRMRACRDRLRENIEASIPDVVINTPKDAAPSILNVSVLGCRGEVLLRQLDDEGICVSTGSACSSHVRGSHVLSAMGLSAEETEGALRFSFCAQNTPEEMDITAEKLKALAEGQRRLRAAFKKR